MDWAPGRGFPAASPGEFSGIWSLYLEAGCSPGSAQRQYLGLGYQGHTSHTF